MHDHAIQSACALAKQGFCGAQLFTVCVRDKLGDVIEASRQLTTGALEATSPRLPQHRRICCAAAQPRLFFVVFDTAPARCSGDAAAELGALAKQLASHVLHARAA